MCSNLPFFPSFSHSAAKLFLPDMWSAVAWDSSGVTDVYSVVNQPLVTPCISFPSRL